MIKDDRTALNVPKTRLGKWLHKMVDLIKEHAFYPILGRIHILIERSSRSWAYARFGWLNYDFDYAYLWPLMVFKLQRLHDILVRGHLHQDPNDIKALVEAIEICKRLGAHEYEEPYVRVHDEKWGALNHESVPNYNSDGKIRSYQIKFFRSKATTEVENTKERKEFRKIEEMADKDRRNDLDRLNTIFKEKAPNWWE